MNEPAEGPTCGLGQLCNHWDEVLRCARPPHARDSESLADIVRPGTNGGYEVRPADMEAMPWRSLLAGEAHSPQLNLVMLDHSGCEAVDLIWRTYFPHIQYTHRSQNTLHLTDCQQEIWVNEVLLLSLWESCLEDVVHHHSQFFGEAQLKMRVHQKQGWRRNEGNWSLNMHHVILSKHLPAFWRRVQAHAHRHDQFRDLLLFCHSKDVKLDFKAGTFQVCRAKFLDYMNAHFDLTQMVRKEAWVNIAFEDTPAKPVTVGDLCVTLLRRTSCLRR